MKNSNYSNCDFSKYLYKKYGKELRNPYENMKPVQDCFEIEYEEIFCLYGEEILNDFEKYASDKEWEKYQKTRAIFQYVFLINWALSHYLEYVFDTYIKTEEDSQKIHENYQEVLRKWKLKERLLIAGNL